MNFKNITNDLISRPSTYFIIIFAIFISCLPDCIKFLTMASETLIHINEKYYIDMQTGLYAFFPAVCGTVFLLILHAELLCEYAFGFKFACKILQNKIIKIIIIPIFLYGLCFIVPSLLLVIVASIRFTLKHLT